MNCKNVKYVTQYITVKIKYDFIQLQFVIFVNSVQIFKTASHPQWSNVQTIKETVNKTNRSVLKELYGRGIRFD